MNPRLLGKPGVGKTTLAYAAGRRMGRDVYILQATLDTRPDDLLVTPVIEGEGRLRYVASPLVTAMLRGGIAILDEGNRMSEKSWASLAPFRMRIPEGCILNAPRPYAVSVRHVIGHLLPDLMMGCLHQAVPERVTGEGASALWNPPLRGGASVSGRARGNWRRGECTWC